jgi:hypothetical protein
MQRLPDRGLLRLGLQAQRAELFFRLAEIALVGQQAANLEQHFRLARRGLENALGRSPSAPSASPAFCRPSAFW